MDSTKSPAKRVARNISHPMPRRSTKGPLDTVEDPLSASTAQEEVAPVAPAVKVDTGPVVVSPAVVDDTDLLKTSSEPIPIPAALRFLQNAALYHQIPRDQVPQAFLRSQHQPTSNTPLPELLAKGHFRAAAEAVLSELLNPNTRDLTRLFQLVYTRLACLLLLSRFELALDEGLPLLDYLTSNAPGVVQVIPHVPWELRILLVRILATSRDDNGRRAILTLYNYAGEVRAHLRDARSASNEAALAIWTPRLRELGLHVSDVLVEIGEPDAALRHLSTLGEETDDILARKALLLLQAGDLAQANVISTRIHAEHEANLCKALIAVAAGDVTDADQAWQGGSVDLKQDELRLHNRAVHMLYAGHIEAAVEMLQALTSTHEVFHTLLFNLSTMHELCGDTANAKKYSLIDSLAAASSESSISWERTTADFKL